MFFHYGRVLETMKKYQDHITILSKLFKCIILTKHISVYVVLCGGIFSSIITNEIQFWQHKFFELQQIHIDVV